MVIYQLDKSTWSHNCYPSIQDQDWVRITPNLCSLSLERNWYAAQGRLTSHHHSSRAKPPIPGCSCTNQLDIWDVKTTWLLKAYFDKQSCSKEVVKIRQSGYYARTMCHADLKNCNEGRCVCAFLLPKVLMSQGYNLVFKQGGGGVWASKPWKQFQTDLHHILILRTN